MSDIAQDENHYCQVHPDRETELRCNKCDRYMCAQCAVSTPVGYRCRECVRQVEDKFFNGTNTDYVVVFAISMGLSLIGGAVASLINFLILTFFLGIFWAGFIGEACLRMTNRRRGRNTGQISAIGAVLGGFLGATIYSILAHGDRYRAVINWANQLNISVEELVAQMQFRSDMYMPLGDFILANLVSAGVLIFVGVTAVTVYARMKS
ncbi:MAG TPA: B-box zinc finger protein [Aggregatilineales bacterium]|nr:B-box zinc finger protein [Aggregatilineales bacterium]